MLFAMLYEPQLHINSSASYCCSSKKDCKLFRELMPGKLPDVFQQKMKRCCAPVNNTEVILFINYKNSQS